jgi:restriction system protein
MAQETLFQLLSRQPWWLSMLVAAVLYGGVHFIYAPIAPFVALPFAIVAVIIAYKQFRGGGVVNTADRLAALRAMSWENFSLIISEAYRRQGYVVKASTAAAYDFAVTKSSRTTLVQCRRWKVNQVGEGPVKELNDAVGREDAYNGVCIAAGEFSANARAYAAGKPVTLLAGTELANLVGNVKSRRWSGG